MPTDFLLPWILLRTMQPVNTNDTAFLLHLFLAAINTIMNDAGCKFNDAGCYLGYQFIIFLPIILL